MDAVIYLRVSTKEQASNDEAGEGYSIPAQREACLRHIAERGGASPGSSPTPASPPAPPTDPC